MRSLIAAIGLRPLKRLGQNFTVDPELVEEISSRAWALGCGSGTVVEVGAGFGFITLALSPRCSKIVAVELDRRIYRAALKILSCLGNVELVLGDAVELVEELKPQGVVGSIPYSITGPLTGSIARSGASWAVLVLQKDVADRLTAPPGSRGYGSVSAMASLVFEIELGKIYPPSSFYPEPEVFSQCVVMRRRPGIIVSRSFEAFLKCLFSQRKRLLHKAVRHCTGAEIPSTGLRVFQTPPEELYRIYLSAAEGSPARR